MIDLIGQQFGRLIVVQRMNNNKWGQSRWLCQCNCGNKKTVASRHLKAGCTRSCGCLKIKHGHNTTTKITKTYTSWSHMKDRCVNPNHKHYHHYGGRGITVCEKWLKFQNFLEDMGESPGPGYSIERINNNEGYYPENCKWATSREQHRNMRSNILIQFNGKTQCLIEWSEETGIPYTTLFSRINRLGWSIKKALITPVGKYKRKKQNDKIKI